MLNNSSTPFTMPVTPCGNGGFGNFGEGVIWIILLFALIFGWNGNGFGYGRGGFGGSQVGDNYILASDMSQISKQISDTYNMTDRKFEGLANGMCSMGYETQGLINGVNTNILQGTNAIQTQLAQCLKNFRKAIDKVFANKLYAVGTYA